MSELTPISQTSASSPVDDATFGDFDEEDLIQVEMQSAGVDQQDLKIQKDEIQQRNDHLKELQSILAKLDAAVPQDASKDTGSTTVTMTEDEWRALAATDAGKAMSGTSGNYIPADRYSAGQVTVDFNAGDASKCVNALKDDIQALSQDSQLDMISMQSRLNNYNQRVEGITNMVQKMSDTAGKIVGNFR